MKPATEDEGACGPSEGVIAKAVQELCAQEIRRAPKCPAGHRASMPSLEALSDVLKLLRSVLFPGYFGPSEHRGESLRYHVGAALGALSGLLAEQVRRGFCFTCEGGDAHSCEDCERRSREIASALVSGLPGTRKLLLTDVQAAYEGDPAAKSPGEAVFCYPSIRALTNYRVAHELERQGVPVIPRIITEMAHSETGIDIHPGAEIAERFFMDHGTGIVIGETCRIGRNVRVYQGVTLGAKSFPLDGDGNPVKGVARHPIVEDDVIIYSGATILGRVTIGRGSVIGGNVWLTRDVPPGSKLLQGLPGD